MVELLRCSWFVRAFIITLAVIRADSFLTRLYQHNYDRTLQVSKTISFGRLTNVPTMAIAGGSRYSSSNWIECIRSFPSSRILARTKTSIICCSFWTAFITVLSKKNLLRASRLPTIMHSILGSALGLLLVFRTNSGMTIWIISDI